MNPIIICDVDGTLNIIDDNLRKKMISGNHDYIESDFESLKPNKPVIDLIFSAKYKHDIFFVTERSEKFRDITIDFISCNIKFCSEYVNEHLLMRPIGSLDPGNVLKPKLIKGAGIDFKDIAFVLEDSNYMVDAYRELDIPCFQVKV